MARSQVLLPVQLFNDDLKSVRQTLFPVPVAAASMHPPALETLAATARQTGPCHACVAEVAAAAQPERPSQL
jgi:hypothetical protein|eukprot:COSAG03_NODE_569_length_6899_cov_3.150147_6_plen_72_part_00